MDPESRCSISGSIFLLAGGPISWRSKLQSSVSQSSTEAEYVASSEAAKEAVWLHQLLRDLNQDNTKHIDVCHHFVRNCVSNGSIILRPIASADNIADICTKPLGKSKFSFLRSMLGLVRLNE